MVIYYIAEKEWDKVIFQGTLDFLLFLIIMIAVIVDLYHSIQKRKKQYIATQLKRGIVTSKSEVRMGCKISSKGLRRTVEKFNKYSAMFIYATLFDIINPIWFVWEINPFPIVGIFTVAVVVYTERISVLETIDDKASAEFEKNAKDLMHIIKTLSNDVREISGDLADIKENERRIKGEMGEMGERDSELI